MTTIEERAKEVSRLLEFYKDEPNVQLACIINALKEEDKIIQEEKRNKFIEKAWDFMSQHIKLIGSPMELKQKFRKAMEE